MTVPTEVLSLVQNSGNNFHAKVVRWLEDHGWHTTISPYYMDQTQSKAREIDLIAEKNWPITSGFGKFQGDVVVRLFIECKFVPAASVFWFTSKDRSEALKLVCESGNFRPDNSYTEKHHYLKNEKVAKLFASNPNKTQEVEPFYKALNQSLNALVSMRYKPTQLREVQSSKEVVEIINFPVVVCSSFSNLWAVDFYAGTEPQQIHENFQLEVRYAYTDAKGRNGNEYFLLDFVEFSQLEAYVSALEIDAKASAYLSSK